jgi:hypothetical protein
MIQFLQFNRCHQQFTGTLVRMVAGGVNFNFGPAEVDAPNEQSGCGDKFGSGCALGLMTMALNVTYRTVESADLGFALQNNQLDRIKKARDKSEEVQMK